MSSTTLFVRNSNGKRPGDAAPTYYTKEFVSRFMADVVEAASKAKAPLRGAQVGGSHSCCAEMGLAS